MQVGRRLRSHSLLPHGRASHIDCKSWAAGGEPEPWVRRLLVNASSRKLSTSAAQLSRRSRRLRPSEAFRRQTRDVSDSTRRSIYQYLARSAQPEFQICCLRRRAARSVSQEVSVALALSRRFCAAAALNAALLSEAATELGGSPCFAVASASAPCIRRPDAAVAGLLCFSGVRGSFFCSAGGVEGCASLSGAVVCAPTTSGRFAGGVEGGVSSAAACEVAVPPFRRFRPDLGGGGGMSASGVSCAVVSADGAVLAAPAGSLRVSAVRERF